MPHFTWITDDDGIISQMLRDGEPYDSRVRLEQVYAIVSTYFRLASADLEHMAGAHDDAERRFWGLQAFLMSLTGIEAFTNTFFRLHGMQTGSADLVHRAEQQGPLVLRLQDCLALAFPQPLEDQDALLERVRELYRLRNRIVHPRWEPASLTITGPTPLIFEGLAENFQALFEDQTLCREAYYWCVLVVARVARALGQSAIDGFCFHWTGIYGLTEEILLNELGL